MHTCLFPDQFVTCPEAATDKNNAEYDKTENFAVYGIVPLQKTLRHDGTVEYKVFGVPFTAKQYENAIRFIEKSKCGAVCRKPLQSTDIIQNPTEEFVK